MNVEVLWQNMRKRNMNCRSSGRFTESDNHFRQLFYHPVFQGVYNYHQTKNMPLCFCRHAGLFLQGKILL